MKKWIVFDVDDVLVNFRQSLVNSFIPLGIHKPWENWTHYNHVNIFEMSDEKELHHHMIKHQVIEKISLEPEVFEIFHYLKNKNFHIGLLTARGWHPQGVELTQKFVEKFNLPVDKIVVSKGHMFKKSVHINDFNGQIEFYLDDSIHHIEDFKSHGISAFLVDRPWNQNSSLPRLHKLQDIIDIVDKKNNLKIR